MKIIDAQSSVPTNQDGLVIYSGELNIAGTGNKITLQTTCRYWFFAVFYADVMQAGSAEPVPFHNRFVFLGYEPGADSSSNVNFTVTCPTNCTLKYLVIGSKTSSIPSTYHRELSTEDKDYRYTSTTRELKAIIANAGTSATELQNNTGRTFTYTKPGTGVYRITADSVIFTNGRYLPFVQIEGESGVSYAATNDVTVNYVSTTVIEVQCRLDGANADLPTGLRIFLSVELFPIV